MCEARFLPPARMHQTMLIGIADIVVALALAVPRAFRRRIRCSEVFVISGEHAFIALKGLAHAD